MSIEFGFCNVHVAERFEDAVGTVTFGIPKPMPNAKSTDFAPVGDSTEVYADNKKVKVLVGNQGYNGSIVFLYIPDWFAEKFLGCIKTKEGTLIEDANLQPKPFALSYQIENDNKARRYWYTNCTATRPNTASATKEAGITPSEQTLTITAMPDSDIVDGITIVRNVTTIETDPLTYSTWFDEVKIPSLEKDEEETEVI